MNKNKGLALLACTGFLSISFYMPVFAQETNQEDAVEVWDLAESSDSLSNLLSSTDSDLNAELDETIDSSAEFDTLDDDFVNPEEEVINEPTLTPKVILEGVPAGETLDPEAEFIENSTERYLEPALPPGPKERSPEIYLENNGLKHGFLTGYVTKRADIDLKVMEHPPSEVPPAARFQIANYGDFIRIAQLDTQLLLGYSKNYFGFRSVYLQKDYDNERSFWARFKLAPSGQNDYYMIRSMREPKKCLSVGWTQKLRLARCNTKNQWQQWRFHREKSDAYWIPDLGVGLDIL